MNYAHLLVTASPPLDAERNWNPLPISELALARNMMSSGSGIIFPVHRAWAQLMLPFLLRNAEVSNTVELEPVHVSLTIYQHAPGTLAVSLDFR